MEFSERLKKFLSENKHLNPDKIANNAIRAGYDISGSYIRRIIYGNIEPKYNTIKAIAAGTNMPVSFWMEEGEIPPIPSRSFDEIISDLQKIKENSTSVLVEIPVRGNVPGTYPLSAIDNSLKRVTMIKGIIGEGYSEMYALIVKDDSLVKCRNINLDDYLLVEPPDKDIVNDDIYIVHLKYRQDIIARLIKKDNDQIVLSSDKENKKVNLEEIDIIGHVVYSMNLKDQRHSVNKE